jgi:hypothetical protein
VALMSSLSGGSGHAQVADLFKIFKGTTIDVIIEHPPDLPLKIKTVALAEPTGRCADSLSTRLEEALVAAGVTVIDRRHLQEVLSEHKLQISGMVDERTASRIGKLFGAQALLFLQVQECDATRDRQEAYTNTKTQATVYNHITAGRVAGSVRVVDLTTGRVMAAPRFEGSASSSNQQNHPPNDVVIAAAEKSAVTRLSQLMVPWRETKSMDFFSDSACDLKAASRLLNAKDVDGALVQSEQNLQKCKASGVKAATLARAYYNLGILQFSRRDYDAAMMNLTQADKVSSARVFLNAIADCRTAKELSIALLQHQGEMSPVATGQSTPTFPTTTKQTTTKADKAAADTKRNQTVSMEDRLSRLQGLLDKKLITASEYEERRREILNEI